MTLLPLELRWWTSTGEPHVLRIDRDGVPTLEGAPGEQRRPGPARRGVRWSDHDESVLLTNFESGATLDAIANELGRSRGSVAARLVRLGRLPEADAGLRFPVARPTPAP